MSAGAWNFKDAVAGASWARTLTWSPKNADGTAGTPYNLTTAVRGIFRVKKGDVIELGAVVLGGTTGKITFSLTDDQTYRLLGRANYTLAVVYSVNDIRPVLNGRFTTLVSALVPTLEV